MVTEAHLCEQLVSHRHVEVEQLRIEQTALLIATQMPQPLLTKPCIIFYYYMM